jgi:hypothetical protein
MPQAVSMALADLVLDLPRKDWNAFYLDQEKKLREAAEKREKDRRAERHPGTKPSLELKAYTGTYEEPAYGQVEVTQDRETLTLRWSNFKPRLEHFHFDTFTATGVRELPGDSRVTFRLDGTGEVEGMTFLGQRFKKVVKPPRP